MTNGLFPLTIYDKYIILKDISRNQNFLLLRPLYLFLFILQEEYPRNLSHLIFLLRDERTDTHTLSCYLVYTEKTILSANPQISPSVRHIQSNFKILFLRMKRKPYKSDASYKFDNFLISSSLLYFEKDESHLIVKRLFLNVSIIASSFEEKCNKLKKI